MIKSAAKHEIAVHEEDFTNSMQTIWCLKAVHAGKNNKLNITNNFSMWNLWVICSGISSGDIMGVDGEL